MCSTPKSVSFFSPCNWFPVTCAVNNTRTDDKEALLKEEFLLICCPSLITTLPSLLLLLASCLLSLIPRDTMRVTNTAAKLQWGEIKQQDRIHYNPTLQKQSHLLISMGGKTGRHENTEHIVGVLFHIYFHAVLKKKRKSSQSKQKKSNFKDSFHFVCRAIA